MGEADIQAVEARARPERETTQAIARRVLDDFADVIGLEPDLQADWLCGVLREALSCSAEAPVIAIGDGVVELLRRAAAGECEPSSAPL